MATQVTKKVTLEKATHRGNDVIAIIFPYDQQLIEVVRSIPGRMFSKSMAAWYVPDDGNALSNILTAFKDKAWVDMRAITKKNIPPPASIPAASTPADSPLPVQTKNKKTTPPSQLNEMQQQLWRMMEQKLNLRGYTENTRRTYLHNFRKFMLFFYDSNPADLTETEIRNYLLYLVEHRRVSRSTQNQAINAIKFFFEKMLMQDRKVYHLERPMRDRKLPEVLSQEEVMAIFEALDNLKHRMMLMLIYSAGLRRSELLNLRVGDVDIDRDLVYIRGGKGRKDRQSVLARSLVPLLKQYIDEYKPQFFLFEGRAGERYGITSLQMVLKQAVRKAGIRKRVRLHMLRHSFATHLLESGTSTRYIQVLLGHESPKTTEIYAQVTRFGLDKIQSPLDQIAQMKQLRGDSE